MSAYLVVISIRNLTQREIQARLGAAFGANFYTEPVIKKSGTLSACNQTCISAAHFGCVHWTEDDLHRKFNKLGIPITKEALDHVKSSYLLRHIDDSMVEVGWEVIEQAIIDSQSDNPRESS